MPYSVELNDVPIVSTAFEGDQFVTTVKRQFDRLYAEGAESGRVMCVALHPPLIGQPQRIRYLEEALEYFNSHPHVWHAHGAEIADYYMANYYEDAVRRLAANRELR
jgi:hypothetical protein